MAAPFAGRSFLGTVALVFLAIAILSAVDMFLAGLERKETRIEAAHLFAQGRDLMQRGKKTEAIERIQDALASDRGNHDYLRTLAQAQFEAGKTADAESTIEELLQTDSTDGLATLIMGRILAKEGQFPEAISYFRRAIYGHWNGDAAGNRLRARFEVIDLLARRNSKEELLAELLPVQDQAPRDLNTQIRLGRLFLLAGSAGRAAAVFRGVLRNVPANADAYAGLGEAEFARGDYRAAQRDFQSALRLAPVDQTTRQRLDVCNELLMLDPTVRGLGPAERFHRSLKLLDLTLDQTRPCIGQNPSFQLQQFFDQAGKTLEARVSAAHQSEASEANLDLAEQLWQARRQECTPPPATDSPLALVLARLAQ
jgi:tetratricopeptide (TPR) repeat protein